MSDDSGGRRRWDDRWRDGGRWSDYLDWWWLDELRQWIGGWDFDVDGLDESLRSALDLFNRVVELGFHSLRLHVTLVQSGLPLGKRLAKNFTVTDLASTEKHKIKYQIVIKIVSYRLASCSVSA